MDTFKLKGEYIKLGQLLKAAGMVSSGVEAKIYITEGKVSVNGTKEIQRGKKIVVGDVVEYNGEKIKIEL